MTIKRFLPKINFSDQGIVRRIPIVDCITGSEESIFELVFDLLHHLDLYAKPHVDVPAFSVSTRYMFNGVEVNDNTTPTAK
jgi:hypothetical protein